MLDRREVSKLRYNVIKEYKKEDNGYHVFHKQALAQLFVWLDYFCKLDDYDFSVKEHPEGILDVESEHVLAQIEYSAHHALEKDYNNAMSVRRNLENLAMAADQLIEMLKGRIPIKDDSHPSQSGQEQSQFIDS